MCNSRCKLIANRCGSWPTNKAISVLSDKHVKLPHSSFCVVGPVYAKTVDKVSAQKFIQSNLRWIVLCDFTALRRTVEKHMQTSMQSRKKNWSGAENLAARGNLLEIPTKILASYCLFINAIFELLKHITADVEPVTRGSRAISPITYHLKHI